MNERLEIIHGNRPRTRYTCKAARFAPAPVDRLVPTFIIHTL